MTSADAHLRHTTYEGPWQLHAEPWGSKPRDIPDAPVLYSGPRTPPGIPEATLQQIAVMKETADAKWESYKEAALVVGGLPLAGGGAGQASQASAEASKEAALAAVGLPLAGGGAGQVYLASAKPRPTPGARGPLVS